MKYLLRMLKNNKKKKQKYNSPIPFLSWENAINEIKEINVYFFFRQWAEREKKTKIKSISRLVGFAWSLFVVICHCQV